MPDWMQSLQTYAVPNVTLGTSSPGAAMGESIQATIANAPNLEKISEIVNAINQKAYLSAPGRQQELANIERWQAGELDPSVYQDIASQAGARYGGAGFGVDSPAWQAAIQRAIVTNRQALQEKGAGALEAMYKGLPPPDVTKYTLTPADVIQAQDAARARQLELARLQQAGALDAARLAQAQAMHEQDLALQREQYELKRAAAAAELYAKGFGAGGTPLRTKTPSYSDWMFQGMGRPGTISYY